jgi:malate dehydrogenase (oxaloacetate-decarboxylating)
MGMNNMNAVDVHKKYRGKISITANAALSQELLVNFYTPGVADVCTAIKRNEDLFLDTTLAGRLAVIFSNGTRTLGLGNIGPKACYPVMEGKAYLLKTLANVDAIPIVVEERDKDKLKYIIQTLRHSFYVVNLEDIERDVVIPLYEELKHLLPIFHDDRHGTGIAVLAATINTVRRLNVDKDVGIVVVGAGSAGLGIVEMLYAGGFTNVAVIDSKGQLTEDRMVGYKELFKGKVVERGRSVEDAFDGAHILISVSKPGAIKEQWIERMDPNRALFLLANPQPEINYDRAVQLAKIVATGRSDYPNQVNNALAMPGIFKAVIEKKKKTITEQDMVKAAHVLASYAPPGSITPKALDIRVPQAIADAL